MMTRSARSVLIVVKYASEVDEDREQGEIVMISVPGAGMRPTSGIGGDD